MPAYCTLFMTSYSSYFSFIPTLPLYAAHSDLGHGLVYSGRKSVDNYDTCASVFVVLFNGFLSLTSYFDEKYRYKHYRNHIFLPVSI